MEKIENKEQYEKLLKRVEELILTLPEETPLEDPLMQELIALGNLVSDFEDEHFPIGKASLADLMQLRIEDNEITIEALSDKVDISPTSLKEYIAGTKVPTEDEILRICKELDIDPDN